MKRSIRQTLLVFAVALPLSAWSREALAASPQLTVIVPPGVQRGHEHVLTFSGNRLADAEEVLLYQDGVTVKKVEPVDAKNVRVTVEVAPDCRLGQHIAQVRTRSGVSDYRPFFVGALPNVDEQEPNSAFDEPQPLEPNVCVAGILENEDVDYYRIRAGKGQRISIEIEGIRLGQAYFDPYVAVLDKDRFEIAVSDDTALANQDCFLSLIAPEDGEYTILVRDSSYRGAANCRYRLHVGQFPRPTVAYPAGGKRGESLKVQFVGDSAGPIERELTVPADAATEDALDVQDEHGITPSAVAFRASDQGNVLEIEPNNEFDNATDAELPLAFNGRLETEGDVDFFKFTAKKDQVWEIECYAHRIGSPVDPVIHVFNADKKSLAGNDDARRQDAYLRWQTPADGVYYLRVKDHLGRFGAECVYRVEMSPPTPSLTLAIPRADRFSQTRQSIVVPRGNRYGTVLLATRTDFAGPLELLGNGLVPGVSMVAPPMHAQFNRMPVVFEAAEDAALDGELVDLRAKSTADGGPAAEGGFENAADFVLGEPNNDVYITGNVRKLAIAVAEKVPYRLEIVPPKVPLVRRGTLKLKVLVHRDEGFDAPLQLRFPFLSPGVSTTGVVNVGKGATEADYPLNANASAMLGKWPVMVIGAADLDGQAWVSSQLVDLDVAQEYVTFEAKRAACDQGQPASIQCALTHNTPFEGTAKAELLGLPPGTTAEPLEFTHEATDLVFQVKTTGGAPVGNHKTLICQATITQNGEPIVSTVGTTELQINAPPAEAAAPPADTAPPPKALSRLEQLRSKYRPPKESN